MKRNKFNWRVNNQIRADQVRVIGADGKQIGILSLGEALSKARDQELDLVEIAPKAKPPVTKIVELGKFRYEQEKKLKKEKKRSKSGELKEVRLSPFIADHDYKVRLARISGFLKENNKVRVVVVFTGRQMNSKKFGYEVLDRVLSEFGDNVIVDMEPKFLGRHLVMVISPVKRRVVKNEDNKSK